MDRPLTASEFDALETDLATLTANVRAFRIELQNHKSSAINPKDRRSWKRARTSWRQVQTRARSLLGKRHPTESKKGRRRRAS